MASKINAIAQTSALIAKNKPETSAYVCAELAQKLHLISKGVVDVYTFECNGYKNACQDKYLNKLSRENPQAANAYAQKIQDEGEKYCEKRKAQLEKKIEKIRAEFAIDIKSASLSGIVWKISEHNEYYI